MNVTVSSISVILYEILDTSVLCRNQGKSSTCSLFFFVPKIGKNPTIKQKSKLVLLNKDWKHISITEGWWSKKAQPELFETKCTPTRYFSRCSNTFVLCPYNFLIFTPKKLPSEHVFHASFSVAEMKYRTRKHC